MTISHSEKKYPNKVYAYDYGDGLYLKDMRFVYDGERISGDVGYIREDLVPKRLFEFKPQQHVRILPFHEGAVYGRISRCINDGGPQPIYLVHFIMNGDTRAAEFLEDELILKGKEVPF